MIKIKKIMSALLIGMVMISTVMGCGSENDKESKKGRYIEENYELPEGINYVINMSQLKNGDISLFANDQSGKEKYYISNDGGKSWSEKELTLPQEEFEGQIEVSAIASNEEGKMYLQYLKYTKEQFDAMQSFNAEDPNATYDEALMTPEIKFVVSDKDGNLKDIELDNKKIDYIYDMKFSENGDLFFNGGSNEGTQAIYQLDSETLKIKNTYKISEYANTYVLLDKKLIIFNYESATKYNTESGKKEGTISAFKNSNVEAACSDGKKTIYYKNNKGLYKYNLGDKKAKNIIDGSLTSFGDSNMYLQNLLIKDNGEFLALYNDYTGEGTALLKNYKYDKDVAAKPENQITVYSLYEDYAIQQAIVQYQKNNPDVYINYEAGISYDEEGNESRSATDAIKAINTEFMAGKGPDVILLDGLPVDSYKDKKLLEDISEIVNKNKDKCFENINNAYVEDGKVYSYPITFEVPYIVGKDITNISDFNSLVNKVEEIGSGQGKILDVYTPEEIVAYFYSSCEGSWIKEDKSIDENKLKEFLEGLKKIYTINSASLTESDKKYHEDQKKEELEYITEEEYFKYTYFQRGQGLYMMFEKSAPKMDFATLYSPDELSIYEVLKGDNYKFNFSPWEGTIGSNFIPRCELGIANKSENKDLAKGFVEYLLSEEFQKSDAIFGFPVNKTALVDKFKNMDEGGSYGFGYDENGEGGTEITITKLSDEKINSFISTVEGLKNPLSYDDTIYNKVSDTLEEYVAGKTSIDEAVKGIKNGLEIYLSE